MKFFVEIKDPVGASLKLVLSTLIDPGTCHCVESASTADLIIIQDKRGLHELYEEGKWFAVVSLKEPDGLPDNVKWFHVTTVVPELVSYMAQIVKETEGMNTVSGQTVETGIEYVPGNTQQGSRVLVVDDKQENLELALKLLGEKYFLTLASGYGQGEQLIRDNDYDAVLSDCQMPVYIENSALSTDAVKVGETVHNGLFLMFPATKKGARFAIVTDANHHQDWVSAIFDDLRDQQVINGQPVLFINYLGKQWDKAMEKLMSL